ncbi:MAG: translation initiation factor IF-2, partial [Calditrichaeota bacterium]|nr:translation initiation factor IF-2 [Calditrichota bacterium]
TAISDEVYDLIVDKFQREKEQADQLHQRKVRQGLVEEEPEKAEEEKEKDAEAEAEPESVVEETAEAVTTKSVPVVEEAAKDDEMKDLTPEEIAMAAAAEEEQQEEAPTREEKSKERSQERPERVDEGDSLNEKAQKKRKAMDMLKKQGKDTQLSLDKLIRGESDGQTFHRKKKKKNKKDSVNQAEIQATIKQTLADQTKKRRKKVKKKTDSGEEIEVNVIKITEFMSTQDLANLMEIPVNEIIKTCMLDLKMMVSINQRLDLDTIRLLAENYNFEIEEDEEFGSEYIEEIIDEESGDFDEITRHPVVTVMGHVDHGKTSLLDYIRRENVVAGEAGSITQHIGAYEVTLDNGNKITFLDTPGHEAFTAMRARGAQATDIVILIVAADDGLMPQTKEAIDHARAAGVPMIIAISKIDKEGSNPDRVIQQLADYDILVEDWGGKYQCARISSKSGAGIDDLLEKILLEAEVLELKAAPGRMARGVVIESQVVKGKGSVATILVQDGTLRVGTPFVVGQYSGKVKAMFDERQHEVKEAGPAVPVQVLGLEGTPQAGDRFIALNSIAQSKDIALRRQQLKREQDFRQIRKVTLDDISHDISMGGIQELNIIVKGDVDGSVEALSDSLIKLSHEEVKINVIRKAVGPITESDVILASASGAIIVGFHVRPQPNAVDLAEYEEVEIRIYKIVYDAIADIKNALEGMLRPEIKENNVGEIEIREVYKISRLGNIAGCYVTRGSVKRENSIRLIREGVELYDGKLSSLKRFKDDVKEVKEGYECGLTIDGFNDIKVGDILEVYETVEVARKLSSN